MKNTILSIVTILCSLSIFAQAQYEEGYIVNINNQRQTGWIKNEEWLNNPTKFNFKRTKGTGAETLNFSSINSIGVEGKFKYIKAFVDVDLLATSPNLSDYSTTKSPKYITKEIFLNVLAEGNTSLLHYKSYSTNYFYVLLEDGKIIPLVYKKYLSGKDQNKILENNRYKNQLFNILKSDLLTDDDFLDIEYTKKDLTKIFKKYYVATNKRHIIYENENKDPSVLRKMFSLKVKAGININAASFEDGLRHVEPAISFDNEISPLIGFELEYFLPANANKWSIYSELFYSNYNTSLLRRRDDRDYAEDIDKISIDYSYLALNLGPRYYTYFSDISALYLSAAININFPLGDSKITNEPYSNNVSSDSSIYTVDAKPSLSPNLSLGFICKDLSLEVAYNLPASISSRKLNNTAAKYSSFSVKAGYRIFTKNK